MSSAQALFAPFTDVDDQPTLAALRLGLAEKAVADGVLDVAYRTLDSPVGSLLVAATDAGVVRVAFAVQGHDAALQQLADRVSPRVLFAPRRLDAVARELAEYFSGTRRAFDVPVDLRLVTDFRSGVLRSLAEIRYGATQSYTEVALASGSPRAVRAVGSACATNPVPVLLPCHRVVRSDGSLGGYAGGLAAKRVLLELERAESPASNQAI